jgi:CRP/FNR family transcriptional regulator, cyclic AMP receptor protein
MMVGPQEHARRMIVLISGRATVYEPGPRGRRLTVSVAEASTVVGVAGLSARPRGLHVEATMPSVVCLLAWEAFEGVVRRNPEVGLQLLRILGERIGVLETRLADLAYKQVSARLASAILRLVEGQGPMGPHGERMPTRYTHKELASMIGANREATKALVTLRERGAIEVRERHIHVADLEALRRAALET